MSLCVSCTETQPRSVLSNVTTTAVAVITAMTFAASGAAPTALYHQYQDSFGLTSFAITIIFAAYVLSLLGGAAHSRLAVGLHRTTARHSRGTGPEHRFHGDVHDRRLGSVLDRRTRAARLCHRACDRFARRRYPRQRSQPRTDPQQHHGILRPDRRQPRRSNSGHLRARSAPARLCRASGAVRCRGLHPLVHAGNRAKCAPAHIASLRPHVNVPAQAQPRDGAGHAGDDRNLGTRRLLLLADAGAGARRDRRDPSGGWRTCRQRADIERRDQRAVAAVRVASPDAARRYRCARRRRRGHAGRSARATRVADAGRHGRSQVSVLAQPSPAPCGPCCLSRRRTNVPNSWRRSTS